MNMNKIRTYSELIQLSTYEDRLRYLQLFGKVGADTFGFDRYLNQMFYTSKEWKKLRNDIIVRDNGCDLAVPGLEIGNELILIHHMNPLTKDDIINRTDFLLNPEYLITTVKHTHNIIHYCNDIPINIGVITRTKNDTCPWRQ